MASILDRYLNTDKYQGEMRELVNAQILNDKTQCGLFLKDTALARIGWAGDVKAFPKAEEYVHTYNTGEKTPGIFFKTPRMVVIHCGFAKDVTFIENSDKGGIEGIYPRDSFLYDDFEAANPGKASPYKRRRLILIFLVDKDGIAVHKKPLILSVHGGASKLFCEAYSTFVEQLESAFADRMSLKTAAGFDPKQAAAAMFTPTFGSQLYGGEKAKSWIAYPEKWVVPTAETVEDFFPKNEEDIDFVESVWTTCPPEVYASSFFKQTEKEIGYHAIKPGLDFTLPPVSGGNSSRMLLGARDEETGEITLS
jgi:hypothetical protein